MGRNGHATQVGIALGEKDIAFFHLEFLPFRSALFRNDEYAVNLNPSALGDIGRRVFWRWLAGLTHVLSNLIKSKSLPF